MKNAFSVQEIVLLTGAGFTHNFGGFLAAEMWAEIFNHSQIQSHDRVRRIMLEYACDYESAYNEILCHKPVNIKGSKWAEEKKAISEAVGSAYEQLDDIVRRFHFSGNAPYPVNIYGVQKLIDRFAGRGGSKGFFFTLNQDLFVERHYYNGERPILPGIQHKSNWFSTQFRQVLTHSDYCTLPTKDELDKFIKEYTFPGQFFYIKLHGSQNWIGSRGARQLVIGRNKKEQIKSEPLLLWYHDVFKKVLSYPERRLLVIGYGFGDDYINKIILDSIRKNKLKLYIISPERPDKFPKKLPMERHVIFQELFGYFPYSLKQIFPADQSETTKYENLIKYCFESGK